MKAEIKKTLKYIVIKLLMTEVQKRQISFWQRAELEYRTIIHSLYSRDQKETHTVHKKLSLISFQLLTLRTNPRGGCH